MKRDFALMLVDATKGNEEELTLHEQYNGRGMHGNYTTGVTGSTGAFRFAIAMVGAEIADEEMNGHADINRDDFAMAMERTRSDTMGVSDLIFY